MSAVLFPRMSTASPEVKPKESRIPVPLSPIPFRRSASMRLRGERYSEFSLSPNRSFTPTSNRIGSRADISLQPTPRPGCGAPPPLVRGRSFMERGERGSRNGAHPAVGGATRPQHLDAAATEPRSPRTPGTPRTPRGPLTPSSPARIRSLSLSLSSSRLSTPNPRSPAALTASPRTPPTSPDVKNLSTAYLDWDDTESIASLTSVTSVGSCDHASVARNGTTFSGRSMKYVFHCNQHAGATGEDYLTPTQRVHRQVKKLKYLLHQAKKDLDDKDSDILKLTKEVVELRIYKAALNSPEDKSNSSDAVTVRENTDDQITPDNIDGLNTTQNEMSSSYTDSGHFEDYSNHSKDGSLLLGEEAGKSPYKQHSRDILGTADKAVSAALGDSLEHNKLIVEYEKRLQELVKTHEDETHQLKQKQNDKIEELLQRITEINSRYWQLVPELDLAKEKIKELEGQLEEACKKLEQQEETHNQGQAAARLAEESKVMDILKVGPSRISVPELLQELQVTKNELENIKAMYKQLIEAKNKSKIDPEITLQFLKSAVYYFLTDRENSQGHLKAIQSILGFTPNEISNIDKARLS